MGEVLLIGKVFGGIVQLIYETFNRFQAVIKLRTAPNSHLFRL